MARSMQNQKLKKISGLGFALGLTVCPQSALSRFWAGLDGQPGPFSGEWMKIIFVPKIWAKYPCDKILSENVCSVLIVGKESILAHFFA